MYEVYESIKATRYEAGLEWIIVDDGSTDNLTAVLESIVTDAKENASFLHIKCIHKSNGGIHTAVNCAVENATGEYITRIDSDDRLLPSAFTEKDRLLDSIEIDQRDKFVGVVGICLNKKDLTVRGDKFPQDIMDSTGADILRKYNIKGDRNFCMKTEIMKRFPIPEYFDTKCVPEMISWRRIDREYLTRFSNVPMAVCSEPNAESMSGKISRKTPATCMTNFYGAIYAVNEQRGQLSFSRYYGQYYKALLNARLSGICPWRRVVRMTNGIGKKIIMVLATIPTYCVVAIKYRRHKA